MFSLEQSENCHVSTTVRTASHQLLPRPDPRLGTKTERLLSLGRG